MKQIAKIILSTSLFTMALCGCSHKQSLILTDSGLNPQNFESTINGKQTRLYTLKNNHHMEVCITNFGGRIVSIMVPDKKGRMKDVVLGFDNISDYIHIPSDFGATIGRYANRINKGRFVIDGDTIQLPVNNFGHCLHGGPKGWQYQVYEGSKLNDSTMILKMDSPNGDQNFPGHVLAQITYTLLSNNSLDIRYEATTNKKTIINLTNHSYFNMSGDPANLVTNQILYINSDKFTPIDSTYITTGEILPVKGTLMDFTKPKLIGRDINKFDFEQLKNGNGYDHNWVLNTNEDITKLACKFTSPLSGITLEISTTEPGIQVYSGNFLDSTVKGKKGIIYKQHAGMALETQHYPDSPNKPNWPSPYLQPNQKYQTHTIMKFIVEKHIN